MVTVLQGFHRNTCNIILIVWVYRSTNQVMVTIIVSMLGLSIAHTGCELIAIAAVYHDPNTLGRGYQTHWDVCHQSLPRTDSRK